MAVRDTYLPEHDPALAEAARGGDADDEVAVIARVSSVAALPPGVRVVTRFGDVVTLRVRAAQVAELAASPGVLAMEAARALGPAEDVDVPSAPALDTADGGADAGGYTRRPDGLRATGAGVIVAALDWGCDFAHPAFRDARGETRLLALWDQRGTHGTGAGNRWGYGRVFSRDDLARALASEDPYGALGYHPADFDRPDAEGRTAGTHGSHVLDIAAGSGHGGGMPGVAPGADLVFVNLAGTADVLGPSDLGSSVAVLEALDFVFSLAGDRPCVANLSLGSHGGPHDGTTLVERGIDRAVWLRRGRAVICSAGNYYSASAHAQGRVAGGEEASLVVSVPAGDPTRSELEIWYPGADRFTVTVAGPDGVELARVGPGADAPMTVAGAEVGHVYHARKISNKDHHVDVFLFPHAPGGPWTVRLRGDVVEDGRFHAWIERERGPRPRFAPGDVSHTSTIGTICCGRLSITVGAFDPRRGRRLGDYSSAGPTRDGRIKPELDAPGERIRAARSTPRGEAPAARYVAKTGTSMAAPHVAGAVALMMEAAGEPLDIADTRALLFASADRGVFVDRVPPPADLHRLGNGFLDLVAAEAAAREWGRAGQAPAPAAVDAAAGGELAEDGLIASGEEHMHAEQTETAPFEEPLEAEAPWEDVPPAAGTAREPAELAEAVTVDDVAVEMDGLRCRFLAAHRSRRADGTERGFAEDAIVPIERWNGTAADAVVDGFPVPKLVLTPRLDHAAGVRRYDVGLAAQRRAVVRNAEELRDWLRQESAYATNRGTWERERRRLDDLLDRRTAVYARMWVRTAMYNRFDPAIARWTAHYNRLLRPARDLDPNVPKSILYQESRMGTSGRHLMPPPSDWNDSDRHPIRSRFNVGQAIDSWGPQQWLMMREMAPPLFTRHGLDALAAGRRWFGMSNADYAAHPTFTTALREFFEHRDGGANLMGTRGRDLHEDYGFWIRTAIRWLFVKYEALRTQSWEEAVRAYNGGGAAARRYRDAVMARVGSLEPFQEDLLAPEAGAEELFAPLAEAVSLDTSAVLEWVDVKAIPDSRGNPRYFYSVLGADYRLARPAHRNTAVFRLQVTNTNDHYNHQDVLALWRLLERLESGDYRPATPSAPKTRAGQGWQIQREQELADESSRVIDLPLHRDTLRKAFNEGWPYARLEVEYRWRELGEGGPHGIERPHVNRTSIDFVLVRPHEFLMGQGKLLPPGNVHLKDPKYRSDFWIPLGGLNFTRSVAGNLKVTYRVERTVTRGAEEQRSETQTQTKTTTQGESTTRGFQLKASGEYSQGASAKGTVEVLELGLEKMFKLGAELGYTREKTTSKEVTEARELSRSLSLSRSYSDSLAKGVDLEYELKPPSVEHPRGTGKGEPPPPSRIEAPRGVYLYPVLEFREVPLVRFEFDGLGRATSRRTETVVVPKIVSWWLTDAD